MLEVSRLLGPDGLYSIKNPKDFNNIEGLRDLHKAIATLRRYSVDDFKLQEFVVLIATFLEAYRVVANNSDMEKYFNNLCFIGDFAEPLSKALKNLVPDVPEEGSVYEKFYQCHQR